jgi:murein L,D-transpeptidase YafK
MYTGRLEPMKKPAHGPSPGMAAAGRVSAMLTLLLAVAGGAWATPTADEIWVHIDTREATLQVYRGREVIEHIKAIAIGRAGASHERRLGDQRTPLGEFRVREIKNPSRWHLFFHIDYPNEERAELGLHRGEIDHATYVAIVTALKRKEMPPQNTPLGGFLGIHGIGRGDIRIHRAFHWTQGCVAVTNEEMNALAHWIREDTRIVID